MDDYTTKIRLQIKKCNTLAL